MAPDCEQMRQAVSGMSVDVVSHNSDREIVVIVKVDIDDIVIVDM